MGVLILLLTAIIWGASFVYYYSLGTSIGTFLRYIFKRKINLLYLVFIAILLPYYTNYFNTTLAFFGNSCAVPS